MLVGVVDSAVSDDGGEVGFERNHLAFQVRLAPWGQADALHSDTALDIESDGSEDDSLLALRAVNLKWMPHGEPPVGSWLRSTLRSGYEPPRKA